MPNLEGEILRVLGMSRINRTISLERRTLDDPLRFVRYNPALYDRTLQRLSYHSVYLRHHETPEGMKYYSHYNRNYSLIPVNIQFDASHALVLYADLTRSSYERPPDESWGSAYGLAICSFSPDLVAQEATGTMPPEIYTLDIAQIQTGFVRDEKNMLHYLGFIRYQELFAHILEQVAWRMRFRRKLPIEYISLQEEMLFDWLRARSHLTVHGTCDESEINAELAKIRATRTEWADQNGYTQRLVINTKYKDQSHVSLGKPVEGIVPDRHLQAHLKKLSR